MLYIIIAILGLVTSISTETYFNSSISCYSPTSSAEPFLVTLLSGIGLLAVLISFTHRWVDKRPPEQRISIAIGYVILSIFAAGALTLAIGWHQAGFNCLQ